MGTEGVGQLLLLILLLLLRRLSPLFVCLLDGWLASVGPPFLPFLFLLYYILEPVLSMLGACFNHGHVRCSGLAPL